MAKFSNDKRNRRPKRVGQRGRAGKVQHTTEAVVTVSALGRHGHGIAEAGEGRLFVPYSLPTEKVRVNITGDRVEIIEIIEPAKDRVEPVCPHFGQCGGCAVQHMQEVAYFEWKRGIVTIALQHQGLDIDVEPVVDAHGAGRRRVTLHALRQGAIVQVGFMQARSHKLNDIQTCAVLAPVLSGAINLARELGECLLAPDRGMDVQLTGSDTGLACNITGTDAVCAIGYDRHMALTELAGAYDLARLALDGDVVVERQKPQLRFGAALVTAPAGAFLQATKRGEQVLSGLVTEHLTAIGSKAVADLFCGVGPYALRLAEQARVLAADSNAASVDALAAAVRHTQNLKPVETVVRDLFDNPVTADELNEFDAVVLNPPRAGASAQVAELASSRVRHVIAVSCDPSTFARDARVLVEGGYALERVTPVDQFKWAAHVEVVGFFRRH